MPPFCAFAAAGACGAEVHRSAPDRHRRLGARPAIRRRRPRRPRTTPSRLHFFDNTDPDGFDRVFAQLEGKLGQTLVVVISKSGGTKETRNGMVETQARYRQGRPRFRRARRRRHGRRQRTRCARHARKVAPAFPDVGLGRRPHLRHERRRPRAAPAAGHRTWRACSLAPPPWMSGRAPARRSPIPPCSSRSCGITPGKGRGEKDMVVLPYKDRLVLFSNYLQQLVMESLGKALDRDGADGAPGDRRLWQQRLDRSARLCPAAARRRAQFLRHLYRSAAGSRPARFRCRAGT